MSLALSEATRTPGIEDSTALHGLSLRLCCALISTLATQFLPAVVDAIVFTTTSYWEEVLGTGLGKVEEEPRARAIHAAFVREYYAGDAIKGPPLLRFDGHAFKEVR